MKISKFFNFCLFSILFLFVCVSLLSCSLLSGNRERTQTEKYYQSTKKIIQEATDIALKEIPEDWDNRDVWIKFDDQTFIWRLVCNPVRRIEPYDESINSKVIAKNFLYVLYRLITERGLPISDVRVNIDEPVIHNVDILLGVDAYKKSPLFTMKNKDDIDGETFLKYLFEHKAYSDGYRDNCSIFN